ncbi:M48 family metallopeptidase [Desulfovibrio intestinalis]|uniref:YgjP-like metallopeptidase domain-containing protein n=1 Tax=Desulfovibrio intestinalis TaxID=58621 RepID=A0A7W8BYB8_9BACT|nr:YgjP-like metallopeptidase domain-containing protein [Desulfovibrio intestinalis]MBB5141946.1 hypothetical protein [Desulfovibrio intestinalis]
MSEKKAVSLRSHLKAQTLPVRVFMQLSDGTKLTATVRCSSRAKHTRISLDAHGRLTLTAPEGMSSALLEQSLPQFLPWLERAWKKYKALAPSEQLPHSIELPLAGLTLAVQPGGDLTTGKLAAARHHENRFSLLMRQGTQRLLLVQDSGYLRLFGPVDNTSLCAQALRQWCRHMAEAMLPAYLEDLARQGGFGLEKVSVRDQRSRWGSCARSRRTGNSKGKGKSRASAESGAVHHASSQTGSRAGRWAGNIMRLFSGKAEASAGERSSYETMQQNSNLAGQMTNQPVGRISLNWRAVLLPLPLLEHLCWHELCHLRHMDHSAAYRAELARYSPHWPEQEKALNNAWRTLPWWALPGQNAPTDDEQDNS